MKRIILKEMAKKPTTWVASLFISGALFVVWNNPIPFPVWHWLMIGNYLIALAISAPGAVIIGTNLGKILRTHNLIGQPQSTL